MTDRSTPGADRLADWNDDADWDGPEPTYPIQCANCTQRHAGGLTCNAYPGGIPVSILTNERDHRRPQPGDMGILFTPRDAEADRIVAALFGDRTEDTTE